MFVLEGWLSRLGGAVLPAKSEKQGWFIDQAADPTFVEPTLRIIQGDPLTAKAVVVAAPGAVGKSTYARTLAAASSYVLVDLAQAELLGGNFFVGGVANAFGVPALTAAAEGRLGLIVDALDEAQLRSGSEGFAAGLSDLGQIVRHPAALPTVLFGRSAAAEEAWLLLNEMGLVSCLMEIEYFDSPKALAYIDRKLANLADRRPETKAAYARHPESFRALAIATRDKLIEMPGGGDPRFAGYAPVLDAVCSYAVEGESLNPRMRIAQLSAESPVALVARIAETILEREQGKLVAQMQADVGLEDVDIPTVYSTTEQLARLASTLTGSLPPSGPSFGKPDAKRAYDRMVASLFPQHPFLDARSNPSNAAFAAYVLVWALTSSLEAEAARRALAARPSLSSGLLFEFYMMWLNEGGGSALTSASSRNLTLADVGPLYAAFASQAEQGHQPVLEITGEVGDGSVEVSFEMEAADNEEARDYGPFDVPSNEVLHFQGPLANVRISAPVALILGDGTSVSITAPAEIDVDQLEIAGRELRVYRAAIGVAEELQEVALNAADAVVERIERVVASGARLSVCFPGARRHPWTDYAAEPSVAPSLEVEVLRRRMRKLLTAFRSHSKGALVRYAAKIEHARMMKRGDLGPRLLQKLQEDGILSKFDAGKFYVLHPAKMAAALDMDYQALQRQRWSQKADEYLGKLARQATSATEGTNS